MIHRSFTKIVLLMLSLSSYNIACKNIIAGNIHKNVELGNGMLFYATAKILSLKYNIPLFYTPFKHSELFCLSDNEKSIDPTKQNRLNFMSIVYEKDLLGKNNAAFFTELHTLIDYINPIHIEELKKNIKFKKIPNVSPLPKDVISIAVHIRKGNGSDEAFHVNLRSKQEFDYNKSKVQIINNYEYFIFDCWSFKRNNGYFDYDDFYYNCLKNNLYSNSSKTINTNTENSYSKSNQDTIRYVDGVNFPPNQYYIDQLNALANEYSNKKLFVHIITDAVDPENLIKIIKQHIKNSNVTFYYENNRHLSYTERIHQDLYFLSRTNVLIRGYSSFARIAEFLGNHEQIIFPLDCEWDGNKLIMTKIIDNKINFRN